MSDWYDQAEDKLKSGAKEVKGQREKAMKTAVRNTLLDFCKQNEEFAQAVAQGGSFSDCMVAVARGVGNSISDLDAYKKAVEFYFPGAEVQMRMEIRLEPCAPTETAQTRDPILLDFSDFW